MGYHQEKVPCFNMHVTDANMHVTLPTCMFEKKLMSTSVAAFNMHVTDVNIDVQKRTMLWRARASAHGCFD